MQNQRFNKATFNYVSPYGVLYLMTNGKMEGVSRKSATVPVFNKRLQLAESESMLKTVRRGSIEDLTDDFRLDDFNDDNFEVVISSQKPTEVSLEQLYLNVNDDVTQVRNPNPSTSRVISPTPERDPDCSDKDMDMDGDMDMEMDPLNDSGSIDTGRGEEICAENNSVAEVRVMVGLTVMDDIQASRMGM
jgi:hypothetical protein